MAELLLARREIPFGYKSKEYPIVTFNNRTLVQEEREMVSQEELPITFLSGYGLDRGRRLEKIIHWLGVKGVYAEGAVLPFDKMPATRHAVETTCREGLHVVTDDIKNRAGISLENPSPVMGSSQGGGAIFIALKNRHEGIGDIAAIAPVGFRTAESMEGRGEASLRHEFVGRFTRNGFKLSPWEGETWSAARCVLSQMTFDLVTKRWKPKIGYAVQQMVQGQAVKHANLGNRVGLVLGERDGVFPPSEIRGAVESVSTDHRRKPEIIIMKDILHVSPGSRRGREQVMAGVLFLQNAA